MVMLIRESWFWLWSGVQTWTHNLSAHNSLIIKTINKNIMEKKIAIKGNNSKYIEARIMVLVYCTPSPFSYVCFVWFVV